MTRSLLFLFAVSLSAQTTFSDFAADVKSHSTARIGFTTSAVLTNYYNLEWDTQAAPPFVNATGYRSDTTDVPWANATAGTTTSVTAYWGHGCLNGYKVLVSGATGGWASLNGVRTCTYVDSTHFTLDADTRGATGTSWGTARYLRYEVALGGLPAGATIYYRACENSGAHCSGVQTLTTNAEPANPYPDPTQPTASGALSSVPTSFTRTEPTVASCGSLQTAINTALGRGETGNVLLPIQKGLRCSFSSSPGLTIGANKNTGYLVIRPDSADSELPPNGVRISTDWEASMVTLSSSAFGSGKFVLQTSSTDRIYLMGIVFENDFPTAYIKTITGATAATPIVYTATSHGYSNGDILQIRDVGGVSGANVTNCKVQNAATNTFECKGSSGTGSYTSGGYAVKIPPLAAHAIEAKTVTHFVIDRCIVRHVFPATGYAGSIYISRDDPSFARSTDINLINSYVYNVNDWVSMDPDTGARATCCSNGPYEGMTVVAADRALIQNNKFDIPGISFFDDGARTTDLTFRRNLNDWNTVWEYTSTSSVAATVRQQFEMKSCFRCLLDGNQFLNQWWGGPGQGTGAYSVPILFSGRSGNDGFAGDYGFGDITITNNLIANAPGGVNIGNAGGYQPDQKPIRNVLISNNLMYGITRARHGIEDVAGNNWYGSATFLVLGGPFENLRVEHNTMWDNRVWAGSGNRAIAFSGPSRGAYFRVHNNFWAHNNDGESNISWSDYGSGTLPAADNTPNTDSITSKFLHDVDWSGNVVVPGVTDSKSEAHYTDPAYNYSQANCASYWASRSGVTCHGGNAPTAYENFATVGLADYATHDFRLNSNSRYASGGAGRGSDDKNVGADPDVIDAAVGKVKNVRVREISSSGATLSYSAPDTDACTVEYGPSAAWGTGSRSSDGGGDRERNVALGGLSDGTTYFYRVLCAAEQPSGSFQTPQARRPRRGILDQ